MTTSTTGTSTADITAPELIRPPADDVLTGSEIGKFLSWLTEHRGVSFTDYQQLQHWSVTDLDGFWSAVAEFFDVRFPTPPTAVLGSREMPGAQWFPGATLNYAEEALRPGADADTAVIYAREDGF